MEFGDYFTVELQGPMGFSPVWLIVAAALVIELDGRQHEELDGRYADQVRDRKLEAEGLRVLRFRNQEVRYHLGRVCSAIEDAVTCP